jgi:hypothetical protein
VNGIDGTKLGVNSIPFPVQNPLKNQQNLRLVVHCNQLTSKLPLLLGAKAYSIGMTSLAK